MRCVITIVVAVMVTLFTSACGNDTPAGPSGVDIPSLVVADVTVGSGTEATAGRTVTVHYTGWLYTLTGDHRGNQFDSSRDRNQPYTFVLGTGAVIRGWDQGLVGMKVGGRRTLSIPSSLAYGSTGRSPIPPNAALVFDIELLGVQ
jgi:FKBP-type peptidyl-prolyl cis-trans isomerase FkpA